MPNKRLNRGPYRALCQLAAFPLYVVLGCASAADGSFTANVHYSSLGRQVVDQSHLDMKVLQQNAAQGDAVSQVELARLLYYGKDVPQDVAGGYEWAQKAVDQGNTKAMILMAEMYLGGNGVPQDQTRAFALASKAAELGNPAGEGFNAVQYLNGIGVAKDVNRGKTLLADAVQKGDINSMVTLGILYETANVADDKAAEALFSKAAQAGDSAGQLCLGLLYVAQRRYSEAQSFIRQAADQGYQDADRVMGDDLHWGRAGFAQDQKSAALYLSMAAAQGDNHAASEVGVMYYQGQGMPQDKRTGLFWLQRAAARGDQSAKDFLAQVTN